MELTVKEMDDVIQKHCEDQGFCDYNNGCILDALCEEVGGDFEHNPEICEKAYKKVMEFCEQEAEQEAVVRLFIEDDESNMVIHPNHYNQGSIECWDAMKSTFGKEAVMIFCKLNAFKYLWRSDSKNGIEDVNKAINYLNHYKELYDEG